MTLTGHRVESVRIERLTKTEASLGDIDGVTGGSLTWDASAELPAGGSVSILERGQGINYSSDRFRPWWVVNGQEWPLGVFVLAAPTTGYQDSVTSRSITLIDKLTVIKEAVLTTTLQVAAGSNIIAAVVAQIQAAGETRMSVTESVAVLTNAMTFDPGTSRLQVINELLVAAGYANLWTDRYGLFRVEPYVTPAKRPVQWVFAEGDTAIHSPAWEYELDLWSASNTVVMTSQATTAGDVYLASAVDNNPDSPTSTVSMGRVLNPIVQENVEASSQADLEAQALRKLLDSSNVAGRLRVSHAPVPLWVDEAIRFTSQGVDVKATIARMTLELAAGSLVSAEWRQAS